MTPSAQPDLVLHARRAVLPPDPATCRADSDTAISATGEQAVTVRVAGGVITGVGPLDRLGCDIAQGYHFARPLPAEEFTGFLAERYARR